MPKFIVQCIILTIDMKQFILVFLIFGFLIINTGCIQPVPNQEPAYVNNNVTMDSSLSPNPELSLQAPMPAVPEKIRIYKIIPEDPNQELLNYSKIFDVRGDIYDNEFSINMYDNINRDIQVYTSSGTFDYVVINRSMGDDPRDLPENVPDDSAAKQIAETYLKSKGLWLDGIFFSRIAYGTGQTGDKFYHKEVGVTFERKLNGFNVSGDKFTVVLGGGGDIIRVRGMWKNVVPGEDVPLITPEEAFAELRKTNNWGTITNISLEYYSGMPLDNLTYIIPVYTFKGGPFPYHVYAAPSLGKSGYITGKKISN